MYDLFLVFFVRPPLVGRSELQALKVLWLKVLWPVFDLVTILSHIYTVLIMFPVL